MLPTPEELKRAMIHSDVINDTVLYIQNCADLHHFQLAETLGIIDLVKDQILCDAHKHAKEMFDKEKTKDKKPPIAPPPPSDVNYPNPNDN